MSRPPNKMIDAVKTLAGLALLAWAVGSGWYIHQARKAGGSLADTLAATWPEGAEPRAGTRDVLLDAAEKMRQGRFLAVAAELSPSAPLGGEQKVAVGRFFADRPEVSQRFLAASAVAQRLEEDGADVSMVRRALAPALAAAAGNDASAVVAQLELAEAILAEIDLPGGFTGGGNDAQAVHRMIEKVAPAYRLGEDLLAEGHRAAEKLLGRAARHYRAGEFRQAAALVGLAARLLGVEPYGTKEEAPQWFAALAVQPMAAATQDVTKDEAQAVVEYCEAMAMAESPAQPVAELVKRARRELEAQRFGPARWWAGVALNGLGMADDTIADDTGGDDTVADETAPTDVETLQEETIE